MKNLPIGIQTLPKLRENNCVYVDKTEIIHLLVTTGSYYFLSRPRRFGKSLLVSTLKELYQGNKAVFEGLWIENNWDWSKNNPVLHFAFDIYEYDAIGLENLLRLTLQQKADDFGVTLTRTGIKGMFAELIQNVSKKHGKVALLIDEYDKPVIDYMEFSKMEKAKENRDILREFYGAVKSSDEFLEFVFITGISKFAKMTLFSHLNNLKDITISSKYPTITGYTQAEVEEYFDDYLVEIEAHQQMSRAELMKEMKIWYNGYSWDGISSVYNPFGTLNFLEEKQFRNFWFATGTPRFLIEQMREKEMYNVENVEVSNILLERYDLENIDLVPLLFQTGYLTIKELDIRTGDMILDYPNKEVRESMYEFLIGDLSRNQMRMNSGRTMQDIHKALLVKDLEQVREIINSILADLPFETFQKQSEGLYHGLVHLIFSYLGVFVSSEVHSSRGKADAIVETPTDVFIFEFKFNKTAQEAIAQINKKNYAARYKTSHKSITGIGVNFDGNTKIIDDWVEVEL
ncbi:MAG: AAA family ATPase [Arcicella sp.]|nr:AAA family ATPase [Arcicella sp.]